MREKRIRRLFNVYISEEKWWRVPESQVLCQIGAICELG